MGRDFPDSGLMRLIRTGQVRVNKKRCGPFDRISSGDIVRIPPYTDASAPAPPSCGPINIVYENPDFLVLNKPGNLPVHPGTGHADSLTGRVFSSRPDETFKPTPVHRLDKNTTGLILFAKSYSWLRKIQDFRQSGELEKIYMVWVRGTWTRKPGPIRDGLLRHQDRVRVSDKGKPALCLVTPVLKRPGMTLLRIGLETGRTHQIRVQLAERGFPVMGDMKYGPKAPGNQGMFLHSFRISWPGNSFQVVPDWAGAFSVPEDIS